MTFYVDYSLQWT